MRITIACSGRFHVGDLARELIPFGHDVQFHSMVPASRLEFLDLPRAAQICHFRSVWLWVFAQRILSCPPAMRDWLNLQTVRSLDRRYSTIRNFGDVFIGMSGLCVESLKAAKAHGARVILERGSMHILDQREILDRLRPDSCAPSVVPSWAVERELQGYELADVISIASRHVEDSFLRRGFDQKKLVRNPYGVDLNAFYAMPEIEKTYDVLTTGTWCRRKGSDVLATAVLHRVGATLLHVGAAGDCEMPKHKNFKHIDAVPQSELVNHYARARVFAMPSHEEGLSMVQAQALAAGLPVIGSTHSGSVDLAQLLGLGAPQIQSVPPGDVDALAAAIKCAMEWQPDADYNGEFKQRKVRLSWAAYGRRYHDFLMNNHG
jgi:starch synthase